MIRSIADTNDSASAANRAIRGLLVVGNRPHLASQIESSLLQEGILVLRTRAAVTPSLLTFARIGAVVLVESDEAGPITFTAVNGLNAAPRELSVNSPEDILNELQRLAALPTGDDSNVYGLGI